MTKRLTQWRKKLNGKTPDEELDASSFLSCAVGERLGFPFGGENVRPFLTVQARELGMQFYHERTKSGKLAILRQIERLPRILVRGHPSSLVDTFLVKSK